MKNCVVNWEDDENNRHVQLSVAYAIEGGEVSIENVTPTKVTFTGQDNRTIGVHTEKGRNLLADQFLKSGKFGEVQRQILDSAKISATV